jgi:hypothetical protein
MTPTKISSHQVDICRDCGVEIYDDRFNPSIPYCLATCIHSGRTWEDRISQGLVIRQTWETLERLIKEEVRKK